jgi:hypothetical protein
MTAVIPVALPTDLPPVASILREAAKPEPINEFKSGRLLTDSKDSIGAAGQLAVAPAALS